MTNICKNSRKDASFYDLSNSAAFGHNKLWCSQAVNTIFCDKYGGLQLQVTLSITFQKL